MSLDFNRVWLNAIEDILTCGDEVAPRGQPTKEILQRTIQVDMRRPILTIPQRRLSYQFMAAEAYWILTGDNRVSTIAPYNKNISQFSDDGETFFGAYGPKIVAQMDYVIGKLLQDPDSRQAGLTIWRECPPQTKDVPCTVAVFFNIRNGKLNCHVFMRSSDVWLGIPYDVFNFSMLSHLVCAHLNYPNRNDLKKPFLLPGELFLTAASSHLYARNFEQAQECVDHIEEIPCVVSAVPVLLCEKPETVMGYLRELRDTKAGDSFLRWWEA
jgi:thymidylate synthase